MSMDVARVKTPARYPPPKRHALSQRISQSPPEEPMSTRGTGHHEPYGVLRSADRIAVQSRCAVPRPMYRRWRATAVQRW